LASFLQFLPSLIPSYFPQILSIGGAFSLKFPNLVILGGKEFNIGLKASRRSILTGGFHVLILPLLKKIPHYFTFLFQGIPHTGLNFPSIHFLTKLHPRINFTRAFKQGFFSDINLSG